MIVTPRGAVPEHLVMSLSNHVEGRTFSEIFIVPAYLICK